MAKIHRSDGLVFTKGILRVSQANLNPISTGTPVLNFGTVGFDPLNGWDNVNFRYTISEDGEYLILVSASYKYTTSQPSEAGIQIWKNAAQLRPATRGTSSMPAGRAIEFNNVWQGALLKNDFIDGRANQQGSTDLQTVSTASFMEIVQIS